MNYIAEKIQSILTEAVDAEYAEEKCAELAGMSKCETIEWCSTLDAETKQELAEFLKISLTDFRMVIKFLNNI